MNHPPARLDDYLSGLPRTVEPASDLWPGIAARARRKPIRGWLMNAAAGIAVAALAVLLTRAAHRDDARDSMALARAAGAAKAVSFALPDAARYQNARHELEATFYERLQLLRPATRTTIEENLQIIKKANEDIRHALESDPASPLLLQLLNDTYQQEFDLYQNVTRNTEPTQGRS